MYQIKDFSAGELGHYICYLLDEELDIPITFDYFTIPTDEFVIRFSFEDFYTDFISSDLINRFEKIDSLVVHLFKLKKEKDEKKQAF